MGDDPRNVTPSFDEYRGTPPFDEYRGTPLWKAMEQTVAELVATRELKVDTAPAYVVGYLCRELAAKGLIATSALERSS